MWLDDEILKVQVKGRIRRQRRKVPDPGRDDGDAKDSNKTLAQQHTGCRSLYSIPKRHDRPVDKIFYI